MVILIGRETDGISREVAHTTDISRTTTEMSTEGQDHDLTPIPIDLGTQTGSVNDRTLSKGEYLI